MKTTIEFLPTHKLSVPINPLKKGEFFIGIDKGKTIDIAGHLCVMTRTDTFFNFMTDSEMWTTRVGPVDVIPVKVKILVDQN